MSNTSNINDEYGRGRCCLSSHIPPEDICGRQNCSSTCFDPVSIIPDIDNGQAAFAKDENAFFLETIGNNKLEYRQACAVESLVLLNPSLKVYVLFTGGRVNYTDINLHALKKMYENLHFVAVDLDDYVAGTPLEHWYQCTDWQKGPFHVAHLSDGLRLITLAKFGGYYFDLDVIQLRPVTYYRNFTSTEDGLTASNGAMHASRGHPIIQMAVEDFAKNYQAEYWTHNGPKLISRVLTKWCGVEKFEYVNKASCQGFQVLPPSSFYPVYYPSWEEYFDETNATSKEPEWLTEQVIGIHVWNKLSAEKPIRKNSTQLYVRFARKSCPVTFSLAPDNF